MSNTISGLAGYLFSKLDSTGKGYFEKTDLESAFSQAVSATSTTSTTSADALFATLDGDGDGKVTQDEMTAGIRQLASALDGQFQDSRLAQARDAGHAPPPPPPPGKDTGFTKDELQSQLDAIGSSDSKRSTLISGIVANFEAADTNGDGKVSFSEAMAYDRSSSDSSAAETTTATSATSDGSELKLLMTVMQLVQAYQAGSSTGTEASVVATA
jgi:Ca2+-binding EF-hand superfamily protein